MSCKYNIKYGDLKKYIEIIEDNSIKYALISNVIQKARYFNEVYRVLKEDGYFLIIDWDKREMEMGPPMHERISKGKMIELCSKAGFKAIESINASPNH